MATVTDHENVRAAIVYAFADALRILRDNRDKDADDGSEALNTAFVLAEEYGWDWEKDEDFANWCLKATPQEICVEGLIKALEGVRL